MGLAGESGHLEGYGPISAGTIRLMLPDAQLRRVIIDPTPANPSTSPATPPAPPNNNAASNAPVPPRGSRSTATSRQARHTNGAAQHDLTDQPDRQDQPDDPTLPRSGPQADQLPTPRTALRDGPLRRALLAMIPDQPLLVQDTPEPQYAPSDPLARLVRTRDAHCTGIGCDRRATACDPDHRTPWPLGPTSAGNLASLSRRCHNAKTHSWHLHRHPDGSSTWTSPTGRSYPTPPPWDPPPDPTAHRPTPPPTDDPPRRPPWPTQPPEDTDDQLTHRLTDQDGPSHQHAKQAISRAEADPVPPPF